MRRFEANKAVIENVREEQRTDGGERVARLVAAEHPAVILIVLQVDALLAHYGTACHGIACHEPHISSITRSHRTGPDPSAPSERYNTVL